MDIGGTDDGGDTGQRTVSGCKALLCDRVVFDLGDRLHDAGRFDRDPAAHRVLVTLSGAKGFFQLCRTDGLEDRDDLAGMVEIHAHIVQRVHHAFEEDIATGDQDLRVGVDLVPVDVSCVIRRFFDHHIQREMRVDDLLRFRDPDSFRERDRSDRIAAWVGQLAGDIRQRVSAEDAVVARKAGAVIDGIAVYKGTRRIVLVDHAQRAVEDDPQERIAEQIAVAVRQIAADQIFCHIFFEHGPAEQVGDVVEERAVSVVEVAVHADAVILELAHDRHGLDIVFGTIGLHFQTRVFISEILRQIADRGHAGV